MQVIWRWVWWKARWETIGQVERWPDLGGLLLLLLLGGLSSPRGGRPVP